ncbi:hypothetical protein F5Y15DRAFT_418858 [Xylariaceae sp. FL0016]|nr:hypothetical protein F5Y15DRAFT_418858 [Xylariaceae sp. FL0016]
MASQASHTASLKYIMDDIDDENQNISSGDPNRHTSSRGHDPSRSATSVSATATSQDNTQDQDGRLIYRSSKRRGPSRHLSKSTTTASSSSKSESTPAGTGTTASNSSARRPPARRRSTESTESMDPVGYGGHGQSSSSSSNMAPSRPAAPMRPVPGASGEGGIPIKLTPVTGRVSRAKKGVPVHICDTCRPPKTFTRAEHLRRHQLSHRTPGFQCTYPGCDKSFHRADLLTRHAQRHESDDKSSKGTSGTVSRRESVASTEGGPPGMSSVSHPSMVGGPVTAHPDFSPGRPYHPNNTPVYRDTMNNPSSSSGPVMSPPQQHPSRRDSYRSTSAGSSTYGLSSQMPFSMEGSPIAGASFGIEYQPRTSSPFCFIDQQSLVQQHPPSLTIPDTGLLARHEASPWTSSTPDSNFSTPSDPGQNRTYAQDWSSGLYPSGGSHGIPSPDGGLDHLAPAPFFVDTFTSSSQQPPYNHVMDLTVAHLDDHSLYEAQAQPYSVRSPTPPTVTLSAQSAEHLVTLAPTAILDGPAVLSRQKDSAAFFVPYIGAACSPATQLSPAVRNAVPEYLDIYWKRFDSLFPLVHYRSYEFAAEGVLRFAMAAVGSQFLQSKEDRANGQALHDFAAREVRHCLQWNVQVMQTILLCEFFARFRGRKVVHRRSELFQSLYSRVADPENPENHITTAADPATSWTEWIQAESRRRLLASCFVLDVHTSMYHEHSFAHISSKPNPPIPLTKHSEALWKAPSSEAWGSLWSSASNHSLSEPSSLSENFTLTNERVAAAPPLDSAVFLASEILRLPRRASVPKLDLSARMDLSSAQRISGLFPNSAVANTYLALHYTPLCDLLAVSGDSWIFSQKMLRPEEFSQRKASLAVWRGSLHAGAAACFAANALLAFLDIHDHNTTNANIRRGDRKDQNWRTRDISDYWAIYVCTLICWALGQCGTRTTGEATAHNFNINTIEAEREAREWLIKVAGAMPEKVLHIRSRRGVAAIISIVRRRLEQEEAGARKGRLLMDTVDVLRRLADRGG